MATNETLRRDLTQRGDEQAQQADPVWQLLQSMRGQFAAALPRHIDEGHFLRVALTCVRQTPKLLECDQRSLFAALMECARYGLEPGTEQAAIVPYGPEATFVPQYQGIVELMYRSGQVGSVTCELIHRADEWDYTIGDQGSFWHRPALLADDRGEPILAYAFATMHSGARSKLVMLTKPQAEEIRDRYSKSYATAERNKRRDSSWHTNFDEMWLKSCLLRLRKWVPTSAEIRDLLAAAQRDEELPGSAAALEPARPAAVNAADESAQQEVAPAQPGEEPDFDQAPPADPGEEPWPDYVEKGGTSKTTKKGGKSAAT